MSGSHSVVVRAAVPPAAGGGDNAGRVGGRIGEVAGIVAYVSDRNAVDESLDGQLRQVAMGVVHCQ